MIRKTLTLVMGLLPLGLFKPICLNILGHHIDPTARIGMCLLRTRKIYMAPHTRIRHLNAVAVDRLVMRQGSSIGTMNFLRGARTSIWLQQEAEIGNRNKITRGFVPGRPVPAQLRLGPLSKLTADHTVDLADSVLIGEDTVFGGLGSQIWTHGFMHQKDGAPRIYIRGKVTVGKGGFIGSRCCVSAGTWVGDDISVGAQSSIAGRLNTPGAYVSQKLRYLEVDPVKRVAEMTPIADADHAYQKQSGQ